VPLPPSIIMIITVIIVIIMIIIIIIVNMVSRRLVLVLHTSMLRRAHMESEFPFPPLRGGLQMTCLSAAYKASGMLMTWCSIQAAALEILTSELISHRRMPDGEPERGFFFLTLVAHLAGPYSHHRHA
jgi:hypothetical protein